MGRQIEEDGEGGMAHLRLNISVVLETLAGKYSIITTNSPVPYILAGCEASGAIQAMLAPLLGPSLLLVCFFIPPDTTSSFTSMQNS